ncbi:efflux RND transporter periplasmic adaptor subunit [Actimicrobium sp. CCC2.4]|uniref:efflux RND transporter periplasmic adaptor subunit n=1 Tax=Actimicrobium sp. CCC2.4 TaxID=3048606 RepID=UPI002AC98112|nr:efflux RND transporter periplasmic adaptor subunit [Actimicrobium sp. CCC2.4]MEB0135166.1 efflux RND transporter periplasmic adaptor subunit [Actimicrobium sp. CCC2.4]WPX30964.1 efflux RND transporter periplasmic adaptor subunit [Actimicrobium sp. CCC2.4]
MNTFRFAALMLMSVSASAADKPAFVPPQPAPVPNLAPAGAPRAAVKPATAQSGNRSRKMGDDMECLLEPSLVANVGSPVEGTLAQVLVDRGADVRRGQVVARLNSSVEAATVVLRQAQEAYGQRKVMRNEELFKKDLISASDKDELETQTRLAGLERKQQQEVLALRTITSPINGVVVERYLAPGDHVAQEKILKLVQIDPLYVEVIAPVELFGTIRTGMTGQVRLDPMMSGSYSAKVTVVDRVIDAASGTFGVRLELRNPGNKIPAGMRCNVKFVS